MNRAVIALSTFLWPLITVIAKPELGGLFTDHAVLQRDRPLPIWGKADPGEKIRVTLGNETALVTAGDDGAWRVELASQKFSSEPLTLRVEGKESIERNDILLGDVWLCGGQSNMDLPMGALKEKEEIAAATHPLLRHFRVGYHFANSPAKDVTGKWQVCTPQTVPGFSAVGYYFGKKIQAESGVPIGLLSNAVGGTNVELWISQETLLGTPALASYANTMRASLTDYQTELKSNLPLVRDWVSRGLTAEQAGEPIPMPPEMPEFPFSDRRMKPRCVTLYNGMLAPLVPFSLRGVIWYQGENNADDGLIYVEKMKALIGEWRERFRNPELPFYTVQLAMWGIADEKPEGGGWGLIRDAQRRCLTIPHTGMAAAIDIGDAKDLHPKNKEDVGNRLALWALHHEYGQGELVTSGPLFEKLEVSGDKLRLHFTFSKGGLITATKNGKDAAVETPDVTPKRFAISGEDRKWFWADAVIDGETVLLSSTEVTHPIAARYAYSSNPEGANLYNRAGLPAPTFRTDDW